MNVVGNRPEMMPLDFHLFEDLDVAVLNNVVCTASLPIGDELRYAMGTPTELSSAVHRTWESHPTSARIVEDICRWPHVIDKIIDFSGGLVPDFAMSHEGCSKRKRSSLGSTWEPAPEVASVAEARRKQLREQARGKCVKFEGCE